MIRRHGRWAALAGTACLALTSFGGTAWAAGQGAQTQTFHFSGSEAFGAIEVDFNTNTPNPPPPGISLPSGCWLPITDGLLSTNGNGIMHETDNKTGDWFTSTYTGDASVWPLATDENGNYYTDQNGNNVLDTSGAPVASGHLTIWDGGEDNNQNSVHHATLTFHGTDSSGNPVSLKGHFQFATNANGQPTAMVASVSC